MSKLKPKPSIQPLGVISEKRPLIPTPARTDYPFFLRLLDVTAVLLFGLFMCLYNTDAGSFGEGDQTTHSLVVQEMVHSGNYLQPRYDGRSYYNKPPFKMWLATVPVKLLGESTFSYRALDGVVGALLAVSVFLFGRAVFASRIVGYVSVLALLGSHVLFFGHGVRNAVQDGMMLLLMSLATMLGWFFLERLRRARESAELSLYTLAAVGGVLIGCAALTKNVAGYFALVVLGLYLLFSGELAGVLRRAWKPLLLVLVLSFALPAAYILSQGENTPKAFQMLVLTEVFKRATKGYHFVNHHWIYWNAIVRDRVAVAPEVLFGSALFGLYATWFRKDKRFLFLLIWAVAPVLIQNAMRSKLVWYILPAVPGMALLTGAAVGALLTLPAKRTLRPAVRLLQRTVAGAALLSMAYSTAVIAVQITSEARQNPTDQIIQDVQSYSGSTGKKFHAAFFKTPKMNKHENLYWNFIGNEKISDLAALKAKLDSAELDFVVTTLAHMTEVAQLKPPSSYAMLPARARRRQWIIIFGYSPDLIPRHFRPAREKWELEQRRGLFAYGAGEPGRINSVGFLTGRGPATALSIDGDEMLHHFGTEGRISLASILPAAQGAVRTSVFVNETLVAEFPSVIEGFNNYSFTVPPGTWKSGRNQLLFKTTLPEGSSVGRMEGLMLFDSLELALPGSPTITSATDLAEPSISSAEVSEAADEFVDEMSPASE